MRNNDQIRVSDKFRDLVDEIRSKCYIHSGKLPSIRKVTEVIAEKVSKEEICNELE